MIVAARTTHGETEKNLSHRSGDFVQHILPQLGLEIRISLPGPHAQESEGDQAVRSPVAAFRSRSAGRHFVACKLLLDKAVVGLILIQRANHVVAIAPGGRPFSIDSEAIGLGETRQVEPVPGPPFAVP